MEQMTTKKPRYNEIIFTEEQQTQIIDMYVNQNMSTVKIGNIFNCGNKVKYVINIKILLAGLTLPV